MQVIEVIDPEDSIFFYDPKWKELRIVSGVSLWLNYDTKRFEIDRTPAEDSDLIPIDNCVLKPENSGLTFTVDSEVGALSFNISSRHRCDQLLYATIADIYQGAFHTDANDEDKIMLMFKHGQLHSVESRKCENKNTGYLRVFYGEEGIFRIIENPHARIRTSGLELQDATLITRSEFGEHLYIFKTQPFILALINKLINCVE